jgi:CRP/FNR family transcriptional regulator, transcriptional activator FtrB
MGLNGSEVDRLASIPLFKSLREPTLTTLLKSASIKHFPARAPLFVEGDRASTLYTLMQGSIELFSEHHDRHSTFAVIRAIKPFVLAAIGDNVYPVSARTLARSDVLLVPLSIIHQLIDANPAFSRAITYELAAELRDLIQDFKSHRLRTSVERLAEWMIRSDQETGGTGAFVIPHDKCTLASYLGMEPESLSRSLASLAEAGVSVRGRQISLTDAAALARIARMTDAPLAPE